MGTAKRELVSFSGQAGGWGCRGEDFPGVRLMVAAREEDKRRGGVEMLQKKSYGVVGGPRKGSIGGRMVSRKMRGGSQEPEKCGGQRKWSFRVVREQVIVNRDGECLRRLWSGRNLGGREVSEKKESRMWSSK